MSEVIKFLEIAWNNLGPTYEQVNHGMHDALCICIQYGFTFEPDDFAEIRKRFRGGYWMGNSTGSHLGEHYYRLACRKDSLRAARPRANRSAAISFEKWAGRKPFIVKGERLAIGSEFQHPEAGRLFVTNIEGNTIRMASYKREDNPGLYQRSKPSKLFAFDHKELRALTKEQSNE